jgi:hypothetical protein
MEIPQDYLIQKFKQIVSHTSFNKISNVYLGSCPECRDGKSKRRRLYYIVKNDRVFCHNCQINLPIITFLIQYSHQTFKELLDESKEYDILPSDVSKINIVSLIKKISHTLPDDCINLTDNAQLNFYKHDLVVQKVLEYIHLRRLDTALYRPKTFWLSLTDFIHKNRLVIPFYDETNQIVFYQSRTVIPAEWNAPKYLSKSNGDRTLFNINKIDLSLDKIFITEGPINACFLKNCVAVGGIQDESTFSLTHIQEMQLSKYFAYERIWCLDSQWIDAASYRKTQILIELGCNMFIWPEIYGRLFKDFNEMTIKLKIDSIPPDFIIKNSCSGMRARVLLSQIPKPKKVLPNIAT